MLNHIKKDLPDYKKHATTIINSGEYDIGIEIHTQKSNRVRTRF